MSATSRRDKGFLLKGKDSCAGRRWVRRAARVGSGPDKTETQRLSVEGTRPATTASVGPSAGEGPPGPARDKGFLLKGQDQDHRPRRPWVQPGHPDPRGVRRAVFPSTERLCSCLCSCCLLAFVLPSASARGRAEKTKGRDRSRPWVILGCWSSRVTCGGCRPARPSSSRSRRGPCRTSPSSRGRGRARRPSAWSRSRRSSGRRRYRCIRTWSPRRCRW